MDTFGYNVIEARDMTSIRTDVIVVYLTAGSKKTLSANGYTVKHLVAKLTCQI